jgi:hypothetical protein
MEELVQATVVNGEVQSQEDEVEGIELEDAPNIVLAVTEDGEIIEDVSAVIENEGEEIEVIIDEVEVAENKADFIEIKEEEITPSVDEVKESAEDKQVKDEDEAES